MLPLRPLTLGELLDAAVALLRANARALLPVAFLLALAEQIALLPLRLGVAEPAYYFLSDYDRWGSYYLLLCVGLAAEFMIVTLLDGISGRAVGPALLGTATTARSLMAVRGSRGGAVLLIAAVAGGLGLIGTLAGLVPGLLLYAVLGLAVPALMVDRVNPARAIGRSMVLSFRAGMRAVRVRLAAYLAWWVVRIGLGLGTLALFGLVQDQPTEEVQWLIASAAWCLVNTLAYPALACVDAVLHLEIRIRTEGLDIEIGRARATGRPPAAVLALPG